MRWTGLVLLVFVGSVGCGDDGGVGGKGGAGTGGASSPGGMGGESNPGGGGQSTSGGGSVGGAGAAGGGGGGGGGGAEGGAGGSTGCSQADVLIVVDSGGSMGSESGEIQDNLVNLYQAIEATTLDARYILLTPAPSLSNGLCAPPPMGSGDCVSDDSVPPKYVHVPIAVSDPLEVLLSDYASYSATLRSDARKHLVVITDDDSSITAAAFDTAITGIASPMFVGYVMHPIVGFSDCGGANTGAQYLMLAAQTNGTTADVCGSFGSAFATIGAAVGQAQSEPCH